MPETDIIAETKICVCKKHGEYRGIPSYFGSFGFEKWLDPECPECAKELAAEKRKQDAEFERHRTIAKWRRMNIDEKYHDSTLENFDAYNDELRENLEMCRQFAEKPDGKLVMLGENGNGKTHLAIGILKKLDGIIYTAYEIGFRIREKNFMNEGKIYDKLCSVPLLVIDEVEKVKDSAAKHNWMSYVIGKRYNRVLPIILIANCHKQKDCEAFEKPCPKCLEYHLENDVLSRIIEDGIVMNFKSGDYREKIRDARATRKENA